MGALFQRTDKVRRFSGQEPCLARQVDAVVQAIENIELVARDFGVQQHCPAGAGCDLLKQAGRHFQPVDQLGAGDQNRGQIIGKDLQIGQVAHSQRPGWHVGKEIRACAGAELARGNGREQGQISGIGAGQMRADSRRLSRRNHCSSRIFHVNEI